MNMEKKFEYTYSAKQQEEIKAIKMKYVPKEENKMETLRKLDKSVEKQGTIWALVLGIVGTLIFGGGMSFVMVGDADFMLVGIILGIIGMAVLGVAYPVYKNVTKKQRKKMAPQILALSEELLK